MSWRDNVIKFLVGASPSAPNTAPAEPARVAPVDQRESVAWSEVSYLLADAKYNPDDLIGRKGFGIYKKMMFDEQVKSVMQFKRSTVTGREWYFHLDAEKVGLSQTEAERRVELMTESIKSGYRGAFSDGLNAVMKAMWQGFSMTEQMFGTFQYDKKTWWCLKALRPKPFDTFFPIVNDKGDVLRWVQRYGARTKEITLDMSKFVYYVFNSDMDEHYGWSDLRSAYRPFLSKDIAIRFRNIYMERFAGGFAVAKPAEGHVLDRSSQEWTALTQILQNLSGKSSVILPAGIDLEVVYASSGQGSVFKESIDQDDLAIAKAALVPNLIGMTPSGQTGSYSQSDTQFDVFMIVSDTEAGRLEDALNEQVFLPLARANFGDDVLPRFCFKPLSKRRVQQLLTIWQSLLSAGGVQASGSDEAHIRKMLEFPAKDDDDILEPPGQDLPGGAGASRSDESESADSPPRGERRAPPGRGKESDEDRDAREDYRRKKFHGEHDQSTHNPYGDVGDLNDRPFAQEQGQRRAASILRRAEKGEGYSKAVRPRDFAHSQELRAEYNATRVALDKTLKEAGYRAEGNQAEKNLNVTYTHENGSSYRVYGGPRRVERNPNGTSLSNNLTEYHLALQVVGRRRMNRMMALTRAEHRVAFSVIKQRADADLARAVMLLDDAMLDVIQDAVDKHDFKATEVRHFDFDSALTRKVEGQIRSMLKSGMDLGADHARRELGRARKEFVRVDMQRLGELAAEWLKNKSFTVAGDLKNSAVKEIKQALLNGLKMSKSETEIKADIYDRLARKGVLSGRTVNEALRGGDLGTLAEQLELEGLAPHHLETVIRTNMFEAINEARFNAFTAPELEGFVVGFEYSAVLDSRTTEVCEHMNGRAYTAERWQDDLRPWVPPNHFNCRSLLLPIIVDDQVEMDDEEPSVEPQEGFG